MKRFATAASAALILTVVSLPASAAPHRLAFTVDGVRIGVAGGDVQGIVLSGSPGDATQETTIVDRAHERTLSVITVPFGARAGTEDALPAPRRGGAEQFRDALHEYRARSGEFATDAPTVTLFGNRVAGELSQVSEHVTLAPGHDLDREAFTAEWVTEAGPRLWIVRARQSASPNHPLGAVADFLGSLDGLTLTSDSTNAPTTVLSDVGGRGAVRRPQELQPPAYSGGCDVENYDRATGRDDWRSHLGASFRGVPACGPRPATGAPLISAGFSTAAPSGVFQFDAAELSLRWMYLAYGTPPFSGNGDELFANYAPSSGGQPLYKYPNVRASGTYPHPGDVLCYDTGGSGGHTAVVLATHADAHGTGWVNVMEQNAAPRGFARVPMIDDEIFSNYGGPIRGWLSPRPYR